MTAAAGAVERTRFRRDMPAWRKRGREVCLRYGGRLDRIGDAECIGHALWDAGPTAHSNRDEHHVAARCQLVGTTS